VKTSGRQARFEGIAEKPVLKNGRSGQGYAAKGKPPVETQHATDLLGSLSAGVCIFDKYGAITFCNGRFAELAGQTVRKLVGRKLRKNVLWGARGQPDQFRELFSRVRESRQALTLRRNLQLNPLPKSNVKLISAPALPGVDGDCEDPQ